MVELFVEYNPNKHKRNRVGDCAVRALSKALDQTWEETFTGLALKGFELGDMPSANHVFGAYLRDHGFTRHVIPAELVEHCTVEYFADTHKRGTFVLVLDGHVVCVKDGNYFDSWPSGHEIVHYYWEKKEGA